MFQRKRRPTSTWIKMISAEAKAVVIADESASKASTHIQEYSGEIYTDYGSHERQSLGSAVTKTATIRLTTSFDEADTASSSATAFDMSSHN